MSYITIDDLFDFIANDNKSFVFLIFPKVYEDSRGSFTEVLRTYTEYPKDNIAIWFNNLSWVKQVNRSTSIPNVCRGMHALFGSSCQSKLVECISGSIHDIIVDARPNSKTFGKIKAYHLDSKKANKIFVPCGFLHGFVSDATMPDSSQIKENIFQYYIGEAIYNHENEFSVSVSEVINELRNNSENTWLPSTNDIILSDKDKNGIGLKHWLSKTMEEYQKSNTLWYK